MIWFALRTAPQKEFTAQLLLDRRGFQTFVPVETKWKRVGPRKQRVPHQYPMLVRYVFVSSDQQQFPWHDVLRVQSLPVTGVVTFDGQPAKIPQSAIEKLAKISGNSFRTKETKVHRSFVPGDQVEIVSGAFAGWSVPVESIKGPMAKVLIPMLGQTREVEVALEALEAA
jgi:transcription antitermination factor NusG